MVMSFLFSFVFFFLQEFSKTLDIRAVAYLNVDISMEGKMHSRPAALKNI